MILPQPLTRPDPREVVRGTLLCSCDSSSPRAKIAPWLPAWAVAQIVLAVHFVFHAFSIDSVYLAKIASRPQWRVSRAAGSASESCVYLQLGMPRGFAKVKMLQLPCVDSPGLSRHDTLFSWAWVRDCHS